MAQGSLTAAGSGEQVVPASDYRALQNRVRELHRLLGKKTLEAEILKEALEHAMGSKKQPRLPPSPPKNDSDEDRCTVIGVSRSNLVERRRMDCCDREAMSFLATTAGICSEDVRDLIVAAVESRFGTVNRLPVTIEWLSDNASCYIAGDTRSFASDIGLEPRTTPIESPQSNGMAEAFVRTIKRDYVRVSQRPNAEAVMRQLPSWIAHYNEVHPHKALGCRSPSEFIAAHKHPDRVRSFGGYNR